MRAELGEPEAAHVVDERPGEAPPAGIRVGLDRLEPCEAVARPKETHAGQEAAVLEGAEPLAVAVRHEPAVRLALPEAVLARPSLGLPLVSAHDAEVDPLLPVLVALERAVRSGPLGMRGLVDSLRRHHRRGLHRQPDVREATELLRPSRGRVECDRRVRRCGVRLGEPLEPAGRLARLRHRSDEQEVAPPVRRVVRRPYDEVVAVILYDASSELEQRDVGAQAERPDLHGGNVDAPGGGRRARL